jgi:hypothetical protein
MMQQTLRVAGWSCLFGLGASVATPVWAAGLQTESRQVAGFHVLRASIPGDVRLQRGDEETLRIEARPDTLERLGVEVDGGVLRIYEISGGSWWRTSGPIRIRITYTNLDALEMSGSADVHTDDLKSDSFRIEISGSSNIEVPRLQVDLLTVAVQGSGDLNVGRLDAGMVELAVSGSGDVTLSGQAEDQRIVVRGSGAVENGALRSARADVTVSGSGSVDIQVSERLKAAISGSGDIEYSGDAEVESRVTGSGSLKAR